MGLVLVTRGRGINRNDQQRQKLIIFKERHVKGGQPVLAWSINGMVPAPAIEVTAGDHIRVTFINHFPTGSAIHWHGLLIPMSEDGVPGLGMKPVQPGQTYVYDFYVHDQDVGTHWYHSHYNDLVQVPGGFSGLFVVDPRSGTPQYQQQIKADVISTEFISEMGRTTSSMARVSRIRSLLWSSTDRPYISA